MAKRTSRSVARLHLSPEKAISILEGLLEEAEELREEAPDSLKRQEWTNTAGGALLASVGEDNPVIEAFSFGHSDFYGADEMVQHRIRQANEQLDGKIAAICSAVKQLQWQVPVRSQVFLPAGSMHDAYVEIRRIMSLVTQEITIVDSYVDDTIWSLLTNVPAAATIRILTARMKGDFPLEGRKFVAQHGNLVEIRTSLSFHDRFILIDGGKCWHLGASIKDAGNKAFAMSELVSSAMAAQVRADIRAVWNDASVVSLYSR